MTVKVRKLKRRDRVTLAKLIKKFADVAGSESLVNMVPSSDVKHEDSESEEVTKTNDTAEILETAFKLLEQMLQVIEDDVSDWFCKLIDVTRDEYDDLDFDIEVQIVEQIVSQKGFEDFFSRGSQVLNKIKNLASPSKS
jgi:hypothetical protein